VIEASQIGRCLTAECRWDTGFGQKVRATLRSFRALQAQAALQEAVADGTDRLAICDIDGEIAATHAARRRE